MSPVPASARGNPVADDRRVLQAVARERTRLANALHDGPLTQLVLARQEVADLPAGGADAFAAHYERLCRIADELHRLTSSMHEDSLDTLPLGLAIGHLTQPLLVRGHVRITLQVDPAADGYHDVVLRETTRELLANVVQHAHAATATATVRVVGEELWLQVSDDGRGVDPTEVARARADGHLGLPRIERIVANLGGSFSVQPVAPSGTTVTVRLPTAALRHRDDVLPSAGGAGPRELGAQGSHEELRSPRSAAGAASAAGAPSPAGARSPAGAGAGACPPMR